MKRDIKEHITSRHWIKFLTRDIPFIRNAIIIRAFLDGYKKDIGWAYAPDISIFEKGIAHIYRSKKGIDSNAKNFLNIKDKKAFFRKLIKKTKQTKKETLKNINLCENKLKKNLGCKELLEIFNVLYLSFKDFWNFQYFPLGLEFSLSNYDRQDVVLKYKKYLIAIRKESQYVTVKLEDLIDIVLKRIAKNKKLSEDLIKYITSEELISNKINKTILSERRKISIQIVKDNKHLVFQGKEAKEIANFITSLEEETSSKIIKGNTAYRGRVRGVARIILYRKDLKKIKKDEILISPMTEAFYTPYLKKVKGIVTNEGGITCHAAIISRELKIPCIIGTKIATKVLKDGDLVEVDANKGIVKIIKKAE